MGPVELESFGEKHALGLEDNSSISQFGTGGSEHIPIRCDPSKRLLFTFQLVQEPGCLPRGRGDCSSKSASVWDRLAVPLRLMNAKDASHQIINKPTNSIDLMAQRH